jgi:hypothetical protein
MVMIQPAPINAPSIIVEGLNSDVRITNLPVHNCLLDIHGYSWAPNDFNGK